MALNGGWIAAAPGNAMADQKTYPAYERSRLAAERTLMARVRTSLSMIGFGFTIFKFFQYLRESGPPSPAFPDHRSRNFGLALVILGVILLGLATVEYIVFTRGLAMEAGRRFPKSTALAGALIITLLGLLSLLDLLLRIGPF